MNISTPLPTVRADLEFSIIEEKDEDVLHVHDPTGVAQNASLSNDLLALFQLLDGKRTLREVTSDLSRIIGTNIAISDVAMMIKRCDEYLYLDSPLYHATIEFIQKTQIHPICAGTSYPDDPNDLRVFLDDILQRTPARAYPTNAHTILVPHIDLRVNSHVYSAVFHAIEQSDFDVVVHIGTSHYGWQDRFILTSKDFVTPLGILNTDKELVDKLIESLPFEITRNDVAYHGEHSLEFHHIFLQHIHHDKKYTVLPILVTSFDDYIEDSTDPERDNHVVQFCQTLRKVLEQSKKKPLFIISGDLAHIGHRFGDKWEASTRLDEIRTIDYEVIDSMIHGKSRDYFSTLARYNNQYRVCGLPPVYTALHTIDPGSGVVLAYDQWHDQQTQSAVTFCAAAWY